jgi:hypothetical protein
MTDDLTQVITEAQDAFHAMLARIADNGGLTREHYIRYLSMQYHLTKGVQRHFLSLAGHPSLVGRRKLREFLFNFALEEEPHYRIAERDLAGLGVSPLECQLDTALWWAYFDVVVRERPFVRLGTTAVLENLGVGAGELGHRLLKEASFLTPATTRFLEIHFHEVLPHGDQILEILSSVPISEAERKDLVEGARTGATLYLRMAATALAIDPLTTRFPVAVPAWRNGIAETGAAMPA